MKKMYSAPIAELIEAEMDDLLAAVSKEVILDDDDPDGPEGPGIAEGKGGMEYEGGIFDE